MPTEVGKPSGRTLSPTKPPKVGQKRPKRNKGGRPRVSDAEKARRGYLDPYRRRSKPRSRRGPAPVLAGSGRDYVAVARQYVADVLSGRQTACQWVRLACERHDRDTVRAATDPAWPYTWSDAHAVEACAFLEQLPHVEGRWQTETIHLEPCQVFLVCSLFGWRHRAATGAAAVHAAVFRGRAQGGEVDADGGRSRCSTC